MELASGLISVDGVMREANMAPMMLCREASRCSLPVTRQTEYLCVDKGETVQELDSRWWLHPIAQTTERDPRVSSEESPVKGRTTKVRQLGWTPTLFNFELHLEKNQKVPAFFLLLKHHNIVKYLVSSRSDKSFTCSCLISFIHSVAAKILNHKIHPRQPLTGIHQAVKSYKCLQSTNAPAPPINGLCSWECAWRS